MSSRSIFVRNPNIGRRSRVNVKTGKSIRKRDDGTELFEDYWTESESDEWTSEEGSFSNPKNVKTNSWKESTRIEEKKDIVENAKNNSLKKKPSAESEKENAFSKETQGCSNNIEIQQKNANTLTRRDSATLEKDDNKRTSSARKQNVTSSLAKTDITHTPTSSKHDSTNRKISELKYTGSISKSSERRSVERRNSHTKKVLKFSDDEESLHLNRSVLQENVTSNVSSERPDANHKTDKVSDGVLINGRKSFNFVSVNDESCPKNANGTRKSFGLSMHNSLFSESDDDDDGNFSFILINKVQKTCMSNISSDGSGGKEIKAAESKKVTGKRNLNRSQKSMKGYQKKKPLPVASSDSEGDKDNKRSGQTIVKGTEVQDMSENNAYYKTRSQKRNSTIKVSASSTAKDDKGTTKSEETIMTEVEIGPIPVKNPCKKFSKHPKSQNRKYTSQKHSVEDEVERIHNFEKDAIEKTPSHARADNREKDSTCLSNLNKTITANREADSMPTNRIDKKHGTLSKYESRNSTVPLPNFEEDGVESVHSSSEEASTEKISEFDHTNSRKVRNGKRLDSNKQDILSSAILSRKPDSIQKNASKTDSESSTYSDENIRSNTHNDNFSEELETLPIPKESEKRKSQKKLSKKTTIESSSLDSDNQLQDNLHKSGAEYQSKEQSRKDKRNLPRKEIRSNKLKRNRYSAKDNEPESVYSTSQLKEKMKTNKGNRKRKISPARQNADNRDGKMTKVVQSKTNIISPPPVREPTPGVRRSKRVRIQPLEHWRNQRIHYQRSDIGYIIKGIEQGFDDEPSVKRWINSHVGKFKSKAKTMSTNPTSKFSDISTHDLSALTSNDIAEEPNAPVPIICSETGKEILTNVVSIHDSLEWTGMDKLSDSKDDPVAIAIALRLPNASIGFMRIRPLQEKKLQYLPSNPALYVILCGKLLIQVNTTTFVLQTGDTFHVPCGNGYSIKNLREDEAELQFTIFHSEEVETEC